MAFAPPPTDSPAQDPAAAKLATIAAMCVDGRLALAELDLHEWARHPGCPDEARLLLASLQAHAGKLELALSTLRAAGDAPSLPLLQLQLALLILDEQEPQARELAQLIHDRFGDMPAAQAWLQTVEAPGLIATARHSAKAVERLAQELMPRVELLPSLVAAAQASRDLPHARLLREALDLVWRELPDDESLRVVFESLAELALLCGDEAEARRWAHRTLRLDPYRARIAILLSTLPDDAQLGPTAAHVLERVAAAHPDYPDVQAALIRRDRAQGREELARRRLDAWLARRPGQPLALAVRSEFDARQEDAA
jgi:tetratricopeptide (TPR) repeat protein